MSKELPEKQNLETKNQITQKLTPLSNKKTEEVALAFTEKIEKLIDNPNINEKDRETLISALIDLVSSEDNENLGKKHIKKCEKLMEKIGGNMEEKEILEIAFKPINTILHDNYNIDTSPYIEKYLKRPKNKKIPLKKFIKHFQSISKTINPDNLPKATDKKLIEKNLYLALGSFVNGYENEGENKLNEITKYIEKEKNIEKDAKETAEIIIEEKYKIEKKEITLRYATKHCLKHPEEYIYYLKHYKNLLDSLEKAVITKTNFIQKDKSDTARREKMLNNLTGKYNEITWHTIYVDENGAIKSKAEKKPFPTNIESFTIEKEKARIALNTLGQSLYFETGDKEYKKYFDASRKDLNKQNKLTTNSNTENKEITDFFDELYDDFSEIQKTRVEDPLSTFNKSVEFQKKLELLNFKSLSKDNSKIATNLLEDLKKQNEILTLSIIEKNPQVVEFNMAAGKFVSNTDQFVKNVNHLITKIQFYSAKEDLTPSELYMEQFHDLAFSILNDEETFNFRKVTQSKGVTFIQNLKEIPGNSEYAKRINGTIKKKKGNIEKIFKYHETVRNFCQKILLVKGNPPTFKSIMIETGEFVGITAAAVAGAVVFGYACAATGGAAAGMLSTITNFIVSTSVTSMGAAIGSQAASAAIDGNIDHLSASAMIQAWTMGTVMMGAARVGGSALGNLGGKAFARAAGHLKISQKSIQKITKGFFDKIGKTGKTIPKGAWNSAKSFFKEIGEETGEEILEEAFQKIGEGLAPKQPFLGFMFMLIPTSSKRGKAKFSTEIGKFATKGPLISMTNAGLSIEYNNTAEVKSLLEQYKAPPEVVTQFNNTGEVNIEKDGATLIIKKTNEPLEIKRLLDKKILSGTVKFNTERSEYEYSGSKNKQKTVTFFEKNGYLVNETEEGTLTATIGEKSIIIRKGKEKKSTLIAKKAKEKLTDFKKGWDTYGKAFNEKFMKEGGYAVSAQGGGAISAIPKAHKAGMEAMKTEAVEKDEYVHSSWDNLPEKQDKNKPFKEWEQSLSPSDLIAVHVTNTFPSDKKIRSHIGWAEAGKKFRGFRDTVHFTLNQVVTESHGMMAPGSEWKAKKFAVIAPLSGFDKNQLVTLRGDDTYILGDFDIPKGSKVLLDFDKMEELKIRGIINDEEAWEIFHQLGMTANYSIAINEDFRFSIKKDGIEYVLINNLSSKRLREFILDELEEDGYRINFDEVYEDGNKKRNELQFSSDFLEKYKLEVGLTPHDGNKDNLSEYEYHAGCLDSFYNLKPFIKSFLDINVLSDAIGEHKLIEETKRNSKKWYIDYYNSDQGFEEFLEKKIDKYRISVLSGFTSTLTEGISWLTVGMNKKYTRLNKYAKKRIEYSLNVSILWLNSLLLSKRVKISEEMKIEISSFIKKVKKIQETGSFNSSGKKGEIDDYLSFCEDNLDYHLKELTKALKKQDSEKIDKNVSALKNYLELFFPIVNYEQLEADGKIRIINFFQTQFELIKNDLSYLDLDDEGKRKVEDLEVFINDLGGKQTSTTTDLS